MKRILRDRVCRTVIVTLKTGHAFQGVLYQGDGDALVLRNTEALGVGERGANVTVDGELLVLRPDVAFIQIV